MRWRDPREGKKKKREERKKGKGKEERSSPILRLRPGAHATISGEEKKKKRRKKGRTSDNSQLMQNHDSRRWEKKKRGEVEKACGHRCSIKGSIARSPYGKRKKEKKRKTATSALVTAFVRTT